MKLICSQCGTSYDFEYHQDEPLPSNFPFCSNRCKSLDLAKWLNEEYRISLPNTENCQTDAKNQSTFSDFNEESIQQILQVRSETE